LRVTNPGKFFARAQPDSVFIFQQLWSVDYEKNVTTDEGVEKTITTTNIPEIVAKKVKKLGKQYLQPNKDNQVMIIKFSIQKDLGKSGKELRIMTKN
jgi:hypothetical protein